MKNKPFNICNTAYGLKFDIVYIKQKQLNNRFKYNLMLNPRFYPEINKYACLPLTDCIQSHKEPNHMNKNIFYYINIFVLSNYLTRA
jgi:hypothetical protein